jgi:hypothetical protein
VTPYAKSSPFWPFKASLISGRVVLVKKADWEVEVGNMWEKVYVDEDGRVEEG